MEMATLTELTQPPLSNRQGWRDIKREGVKKMSQIKATWDRCKWLAGWIVAAIVGAILFFTLQGFLLPLFNLQPFVFYRSIENIGYGPEVKVLDRIHTYCYPSPLGYVTNGLDEDTCRLWLGQYIELKTQPIGDANGN